MATANDVHSSTRGSSINNATVELGTDQEGNVITGGSSGGVKFKVGGATTGRPLPPLEMPQQSTGASNTASQTPKTPTPGPSGMPGISRTKSEREKKIGHRRVTQGGDVTYKKIQSSQIMGSIQLGMQHAIGGLASKPERDLLMQDFMTVEQTHFLSGGSNLTPAHHYSDFRFKTYAPIAFRYFRDLFGIQPDDFLISMCSVNLRELSNPGASGSIFYLSHDDEFIIKTVQHKECEFLQKLLPGYYMNLNQNPRTLLPKFFGLFNYICNAKNVRLAVMNNLLPSSIKMHQKYDLKGSTYKRKANKTEREKKSPTYKDLDFVEHHTEGLLLEADTCAALIKTLQRDTRVLESFKIMDYSLLVGIHNLDIAAKEKVEKKNRKTNLSVDSDGEDLEEADGRPGPSGLSRSRSINRQKLVAHSTALESIQAESEPIDTDDDVPPGGIPARNAKGERLLLFLGVIDILQSYRLKKKLEHTFKAMIHDGDTVSVHRPGFYAERFMNFMTKSVFKKIPSPLKHSPSKKRSGISANLPLSPPASSAAVIVQQQLHTQQSQEAEKKTTHIDSSANQDSNTVDVSSVHVGDQVSMAYPPVSTPPPQYESSTSIIPIANHNVDEVYSSDDVTVSSSITTHSSYSKQTIQSSTVIDEAVTATSTSTISTTSIVNSKSEHLASQINNNLNDNYDASLDSDPDQNHVTEVKLQEMFNLKKTSNRRGLQRSIRDDLSMVTANSTVTTRQSGSNKRPRFKSQQTTENSTPDRSNSSSITIRSVPSLINSSQSRAAMLSQRKVLHPTQTNCSKRPKTSETEYWSSFSVPGRNLHIKGKTLKSFNGRTMVSPALGLQPENKSSWTASCGFPIKRDDVSLVQTEVASLTSSLGLTNSQSSGSALQNSIVFGNGRSSTGTLLPSLIRSIKPPPPIGTFCETPNTGIAHDAFKEDGNQWRTPDYACVMQGKWSSRPKTPQTSKKYSIAELADILCGDAVTDDSGLANQIFDPFPIIRQQSEATCATMQNPLTVPIQPNSTSATDSYFNFGPDENINHFSDVSESIYFSTNNNIQGDNLASKKQVSFLMDANKNDCVDRFFFDNFSTESTENINVRDITGSVNLFDYN